MVSVEESPIQASTRVQAGVVRVILELVRIFVLHPVRALLLIVLAMLPSLVLAFSLHNFDRALMLLIVILCVLGLHTLWTGYTPSAP